jgi:hypothetical protein
LDGHQGTSKFHQLQQPSSELLQLTLVDEWVEVLAGVPVAVPELAVPVQASPEHWAQALLVADFPAQHLHRMFGLE